MEKKTRKVINVLLFFYCFIFLLIPGCAGAKFSAYSKNSGYLPVSLDNKEAIVVVVVKDLIEVNASTSMAAFIDILEKKFGMVPQIENAKLSSDGKNMTVIASAHGSGVVISKNGLILTNWHVASRKDDGQDWPFICVAKEIDAACVPALVVAKDRDYDLAVIRVDDDFRFEKTIKLEVGKEFYKPGRIIYNWGFPFWYKKTLGFGYISTPVSPEKFFGKGDRLLVQLPDGPGTSGSGIFDAKTHKLIGIMQGSANYGYGYFVIRYLIPSLYIKKFLDKNKIPYRE